MNATGGTIISTETHPRSQTFVEARERAILSARTAHDNRARDITILEMKGLVDWVDYLVIATGNSRRQIITIADRIEEALKEVGDVRRGIEGYELGNWIILDYGDIVVHVFNEEKREYYQLEHLWADAEHIPWQAPKADTESLD
ncbi:Ribosomal silencing factor RsfS [Planctomycetes bacterium Pan216]|uniref:Ribosomal silencing factor RsfS n=1 Tax=Kolteria novifilia TaxID=2527975 RepID=A0A518B8E2_9BACT|nr:Ribosomal silencing factor RsfS [Planctomycetes bacterium Pan216]